jgi:hypothetical protein
MVVFGCSAHGHSGFSLYGGILRGLPGRCQLTDAAPCAGVPKCLVDKIPASWVAENIMGRSVFDLGSRTSWFAPWPNQVPHLQDIQVSAYMVEYRGVCRERVN